MICINNNQYLFSQVLLYGVVFDKYVKKLEKIPFWLWRLLSLCFSWVLVVAEEIYWSYEKLKATFKLVKILQKEPEMRNRNVSISSVAKIVVSKSEKRTFKGMNFDERMQVKEFFEATTRELDQLSHLAARESSIQLVLQ